MIGQLLQKVEHFISCHGMSLNAAKCVADDKEYSDVFDFCSFKGIVLLSLNYPME